VRPAAAAVSALQPLSVSTWIVGALLGLVITAAVFTETWFYLLITLPGIVYVAVTLAHPRWGLLLWLLLAPVANTYANVSLPVGIPDITFGRVAVLVITLTLLLQMRLMGRRLAQWGGVELAMLAVLIIVAIDEFVRGSNQMSEMLKHFDARVAPFLLFLAARNLCVFREDLKYVGYILAVVGCYLAFHGTFQYFTYSPDDLARLDPSLIEQMGHQAGGRAVGPFLNSVEFGAVVAVAFVSTLVLVLHGSSGITRWALIAALAPLAAGVILSATRAVWLGWYLSLLIMALFSRKGRSTLLFSVAGATILAAALSLALSEASFLKQRTVEAGGVTSRLTMYRIAARLALRQPLVGYGNGTGSRVAARNESRAMGGLDADFAAGEFHNVYLMTLIEWGIGGLIAWLAVHVFLIKPALELRRLTDEATLAHHFAGFFIAATVIYMVQGLFADIPPFLYLTGIYYFLGGLLHAQLDAMKCHRSRARAQNDRCALGRADALRRGPHTARAEA
jgi:O-antigen ligase